MAYISKKEPCWGLAVAMFSVKYGRCVGVGLMMWGCIPKKYATLWHKSQRRNLAGFGSCNVVSQVCQVCWCRFNHVGLHPKEICHIVAYISKKEPCWGLAVAML